MTYRPSLLGGGSSSYQSSSAHNNNNNNSGFTQVHMVVAVPFATLHYDDTGSNVTYSILCHDTQNNIKWMVKRRYNDFKQLHSHVGRHVPESSDIFPSSGGLFRSRTNSSRNKIEERRSQIERYMVALTNSLLQMTSAKHQRLCQPLIAKLLQFVEYPEFDDDEDDTNNDEHAILNENRSITQRIFDVNGNPTNRMGSSAGGATPFWKQGSNNDKDETASNASATSSLFAVSSVVEEAFNAQSPDIEIASSLHRSGSGLDGPNGSSGSDTPSLRSLASSNAEDTNPQLAELLSNVTTYWAAPEVVKGSKIAVEIPDVACQPTIDGEFAITVRHSVRSGRGEVRRKYDEMLYVVNKIFANDAVPTPNQMRDIILQFRRQNPKRQYNSNGSKNISDSEKKGSASSSASKGLKSSDLNRHNTVVASSNYDDDAEYYTTGGGTNSNNNNNTNDDNNKGFGNTRHSESLMMCDNMDGSQGIVGMNNNNGDDDDYYNNNHHQQQQNAFDDTNNNNNKVPGGAVAIPNRHHHQQDLDDHTRTTPFASPPARGALADGSISQLPSQFSGDTNGNNNNNLLPHRMQIRRTAPRVSNSSHFVMNNHGRTVPYRECKCSELAFCASGKEDHLQTPCGFTVIVEPTTVENA